VALDSGDFLTLALNRQVLVDDADATFLSQGDSQPGFGHGIHGRGHQRNVQAEFARELSLQADIARQNFGMTRREQNVIEGECFLGNLHKQFVRSVVRMRLNPDARYTPSAASTRKC